MSIRRKLSDPQQYVLQVIINRGVIDHTDFKKIYSSTLSKFSIDDSDRREKEVYSQFIREINEAIKFYNVEIQKGICEITGMSFYCFVRTFDVGGIGKLSSHYQPTDLKIFQIILNMIIDSENGIVNYNDIVHQIYETFDELTVETQSQAKTVTKVPTNREIRTSIDMFTNHYWLMEVVNHPNNYTLHGRALIELYHYLTEMYDEETLSTCFSCKKLLIVGIKCEYCSKKFHRGCLKEIFSKNHYDCINCKKSFSEDEINNLKKVISEAKTAYASRHTN